jgi:hypothetical protein
MGRQSLRSFEDMLDLKPGSRAGRVLARHALLIDGLKPILQGFTAFASELRRLW